MKVSDYMIRRLEEHNVKDVFLLSGGGMMHLLDSLFRSEIIHPWCNLHEQASSVCASAYAQAGRELGYLSFLDDRLYYVLIPLFEQKRVQIKIKAAKKQPEKTKKYASNYHYLDMWVRLRDDNFSRMPENLNLQIEQLLAQYARV